MGRRLPYRTLVQLIRALEVSGFLGLAPPRKKLRSGAMVGRLLMM